MFRQLTLVAAAALIACDPKIEKSEPATVIIARFDPSASPAVVPTPNDLATDPATGRLTVPKPETATGADVAFIDYLNSLNGFPASSGATATFTGDLQQTTVTGSAVRVFDVTNGFTAQTVTIGYSPDDVGDAKSSITVAPPDGGWVPGHTYAVGILAGENGIKGADNVPVLASATWAFLRSEKPLVVGCTDTMSPTCRPATELIPSAETEDPAARYLDQLSKAIQLETLRTTKYKAVVDKLVQGGAKREDVVLAWTFRIADFAQLVYDPSAAPPRVPTPNDAAINATTGLVQIDPNTPGYSEAYKEFITDYLNTLDGFPASAAAAGQSNADLDPASVTTGSVVVVGIDGSPAPGYGVSWVDATNTIAITPAGGSWGKGRHLGVVVFGRRDADVSAMTKPASVERIGGGAVVASTAMALLRSPDPLVTCPNDDLTSPECALAITAAPISLGSAVLLEGFRRPVDDAIELAVANGRSRDEVALAWTFKTVSYPEATFDPSAAIVPFPNDVLRNAMTNRLALPIPDGGSMLQQQLIAGLNTLDGFSVTAPIVSEGSAERGAIDVGRLDPELLDAGTGFFRVTMPGTAVPVSVCLDCTSSLLPDGGAPSTPQQLQFVPQLPLAEQAQYAAYLTTDLKDLDGHKIIPASAFALARLSQPLCSGGVGGVSTVPVLSDVQACGTATSPGLEALRTGLQPLIGLIQMTRGVTRQRLALAWAFTTQSTVSQLSQLAGAVTANMAPGAISTTVSAAPIATAGGVPAPLSAVYGALPSAAIGAVYAGTLTLPFGLVGGSTGLLPASVPGGVILPPNNWATQKSAYMLTVPSGAAPMNGWPVVIFGHGLTSNRTPMVAISNALATAGFATLAVDVVWHGERNTCNGVGAYIRQSTGSTTATDDFGCASPSDPSMPDPVNTQCQAATGRCIARPGGNITPASCTVGGDAVCLAQNQGYCVAGTCEGATFSRQTNAWAFLNLSNLFAARDNFRHYAIDLTQLVRVIKADAFMAAGGPDLDGTVIHYVGQSLGGFNGTLFAATNGDVQHVMLNVPGADQVGTLLTSPGFASVRTGFLGQLAAQGITPGTPQFDQLTVLFRTIFDRADPQVFGSTAVNRVMPANRKVFIQYIENDFVVPNATTEKLIRAASSGAEQPYVERVMATLLPDPPPMMSCMPAAMTDQLCASQRHGFLLNFVNPSVTAAAQTKAATFITTGVVP